MPKRAQFLYTLCFFCVLCALCFGGEVESGTHGSNIHDSDSRLIKREIEAKRWEIQSIQKARKRVYNLYSATLSLIFQIDVEMEQYKKEEIDHGYTFPEENLLYIAELLKAQHGAILRLDIINEQDLRELWKVDKLEKEIKTLEAKIK